MQKRITEADLILPSLYLMSLRKNGTIATSELINELSELLQPEGEDLKILEGRNDNKFSQKVRNLKSHKTLEKLGYATHNGEYFSITQQGRKYIEEGENAEKINNDFAINFEGENTINLQETDIYPNHKIGVDSSTFSVFELQRRYQKKLLTLTPYFQREDVWDDKQKSELIESVLIDIPLPYFYLNRNDEGQLIVVDGKQRLTALFNFMSTDDTKKYKLQGLKILSKYNGKYFYELPPLFQTTIEDYQLRVYIIKPETPARIIFDIFDRVNRGGTKLNNQEVRNALYQGKVTRLINNLAESSEFKRATCESVSSKRMKDRYLILRFLAYYIWWEKPFKKDSGYPDYKSDPDEFLDKTMKFINNLTDQEIETLKLSFETAMKNATEIFGDDAFRLPDEKRKNPINMALFESLGYLLANPNVTKDKYSIIKEEFDRLMANDIEYKNSFKSIDSTVKIRFERMDKILEKL